MLELNASQGQVSNSLLSRIDFKDGCVDNCVVVAAVANLATDSATSTVCASHLPRQTTKWLAYGCHTSVLLVDWCVPFLVLFQLCDVPQTLNIQRGERSGSESVKATMQVASGIIHLVTTAATLLAVTHLVTTLAAQKRLLPSRASPT